MVSMCNVKDRGNVVSENIIVVSPNKIRKRLIDKMKGKIVAFKVNMDFRLGRS